MTDNGLTPKEREEAEAMRAYLDSAGWEPRYEMWSHEHDDYFSALYDESFDRITESCERRDVTVEDVVQVYYVVVDGRRHLTAHEDVIAGTDLDYHDARNAAGVLSDLGDVYEAYDSEWELYWVRCSSTTKALCEKRRISLYRYYKMYPDLVLFQDKVVDWFVRRNRRMSQPFKLTDLKAKWVNRLQEEYFPDKPVHRPIDNESEADGQTMNHPRYGLVEIREWSRHIAARYVRTAQDEIIKAYELTY